MIRAAARLALRFLPSALAAFAISCGEIPTQPKGATGEVTAASAPPAHVVLPTVRISEFHYDNVGTDVDEKVEISFPTGMSLTGWQLVLYNGSGGATYGTAANLTSGVVTSCGARSVVVISYPVDGLQNGSPDGMVVVGPGPVISDSLSYEGSFTAVGGPAAGKLLPDIGVAEGAATPVGFSLQRDGTGVWSAPAANTFGTCNDNDDGPPPAEPATVTVSPATAAVAVAGTQLFSAAAADAASTPVSTTITWTSSDNSIATVSAIGLATGVAAGTVTITATASNGVFGTASLTVNAAPPPPTDHSGAIVISQIYGGGGNSGATLRNDFIELFNRGTSPVTVNGWSVQYASAAGTSWAATPITGTIPPGGYYLVQEAQGAGGTVDLPAPDATGTIAMGAGAGKILVAQTTVPFAVACPAGTAVVDIASYGTGTNCGNAAPTISATAAALRKHQGCTWTQNPALDFSAGAPAPRNSASATHSCVAGPLDHVAVTGSLTVLAGATTQLSAEALDIDDNTVVGAAISWTTSDASIATVDANGLVTGVAAGGMPATIAVTAVAGGITKTASVDVQVNNPGGINWIDLSSSSNSLPPGFQTQLFATAREAQGGAVVPATFTFEAVEPQFATFQTVANTGIITGVAAPGDGHRPGVRITATPTGGGTPYSFIVHPVTIEPPVSAPLSAYGNNDAFGDPTPASTSNPNDFLIRRDQFVISYNQSRGTPNWVSYELDSRQIVAGQDRCNCFTADPLLPPDKQILTSDYTNGGFDRGHMAPSADRTAGNVDNATTFYLTNIVPQVGDLNQGVWANFEQSLRDSVATGRAVYVITGPLYSAGHALTFVKNEGKIAIPDSTWKIALIGPANGGNPFTNASLQSFDNLVGLTLMAVNMPNVTGVRNNPWQMYLTTVDRIEQSTGYDFLSLMQTGFQPALDYKDHAPVAQFAIAGATTAGSSVTFDASASTDSDFGRTDLGRTEALTYSWHFSDGTDAAGSLVTKTFAASGNHTATLTVTDAFGWPAVTTQTFALANVAPPAIVAALVRHAPAFNARLEGSLQMMLGENVTLNGGAAVTGKLYVPGLPTVRLNGNPVIGATVDGTGGATPGNYQVTLNGNTTLGTLVRRTDPGALPTVAAPNAPAGTRNVSLNQPSDPIGVWATVRNFTMNGNIGTVTVPAGAYGDFTLNGNNRIVLGVAGATTPSVYHFQRLTLNGTSEVQVAGPVIVTVGNAVSLNGSMGSSGHADWLTLKISNGGLTLNGNVSLYGTVIAPNGTVTVNGSSALTGGLAADRLTINGGALVRITAAIAVP